MRKVDIRAYKNSLRDKAKAMRRGMDPEEKAEMDRQIIDRICSLYQYREAQLLLCYVSKPIEVDTIPLIRRALADGKQVACPPLCGRDPADGILPDPQPGRPGEAHLWCAGAQGARV